uniref:E3 ubiquitin-protein ligase TRIM9 n=1 Tax=Ditylenchus dipsaci TaxID=166011 RepID=A0A915DML2_9BILA
MDEELKCPACRQFLREPVLLNCAHSYCRECALGAQVKVSSSSSGNAALAANVLPNVYANPSPLSPPCSSSSGASSDTISLCISDLDQESSFDKLSVVSETDSGVICGNGTSSNGCRGSRPSSFLGGTSLAGNSSVHPSSSATTSTALHLNTPSVGGLGPHRAIPSILSSPSTSAFGYCGGCYVLVCESCQKPSFFSDENVLRNAKENMAVRRLLVARLKANGGGSVATTPMASTSATAGFEVPNCQWCEGNQPQSRAELYCETCGYFYCAACQPVIHPPRGPLKDHKLLPATSCIVQPHSSRPNNTNTLGRRLTICADAIGSACSGGAAEDLLSPKERLCDSHPDETLTMYCMVCRITVCCQCLSEPRHANHEVQSLSSAVKTQKTELSQTLQLLSEKARQASEEISRLKQLQERTNTNCNDFQKSLNVQLDALLESLRSRHQKLLEFVDAERERKRNALKEQIGRCAGHLNKTTALIQFCIEVLKEPDPVAYIQVGNALSNRVTNHEFLWHREMRTKPEVDSEFVLTLDTNALQYAIGTLDFAQLKAQNRRLILGQANLSDKAPPVPAFDPSECSAENNSVVVVWHCNHTPGPTGGGLAVEGYTLEIDSGRDDGVFKEVYCGPENVCTIDGLHFDTLYNARVKAFNAAGESGYSEPICLQTAQFAWFQLSPEFGSPSTSNDLLLSNECSTVTGTSMEYRTILAGVSFSRGVHYWEISVEHYEGNTDIVLGVAQPAVNRRIMLGKDIHGWSMYVDRERSWFFHNDAHHGRRNTGLCSTSADATGCVIGVLMDCNKGVLSFFINDLPVSNAAFRNMPHGLYYPAFSVNRNAAISVHSGLSPPDSALSSATASDDCVANVAGM